MAHLHLAAPLLLATRPNPRLRIRTATPLLQVVLQADTLARGREHQREEEAATEAAEGEGRAIAWSSVQMCSSPSPTAS